MILTWRGRVVAAYDGDLGPDAHDRYIVAGRVVRRRFRTVRRWMP